MSGQPAPGALLTPEQYMDLLVRRAKDEHARASAARAAAGLPQLADWLRPLPDMMIRDGDERLVNMAAINAENKRTAEPRRPAPKPRNYRPASHWRAKLEQIDQRLDAINGIARHDTDDPAAYGGVGIRQNGRQRAQYWTRVDKAAAEYVQLSREREQVRAKLRRAELREAR